MALSQPTRRQAVGLEQRVNYSKKREGDARVWRPLSTPAYRIVDDAQPEIAVFRRKRIQIGHSFPAIRTIIVEEFDQGDVGTGGAHPGDARQSGQRQLRRKPTIGDTFAVVADEIERPAVL